MDDLISRQAAIDAVETKIKKWNAVDGEGYHVGLGLRYTDVIDTLTELPSAQPERKKGKWLKAYGDHESFGVRPFYRYCSECNESTVWAYNYCPNCGADMRGEEDG